MYRYCLNTFFYGVSKGAIELLEVIIRVFAHLRDEVGTREVVLSAEEGATVQEVLEKFGEKYRVSTSLFDTLTGRIHRHILVVLNGMAISQMPDGLRTKIRDGDAIALLPPVGGG
jgi:MoaD family protein